MYQQFPQREITFHVIMNKGRKDGNSQGHHNIHKTAQTVIVVTSLDTHKTAQTVIVVTSLYFQLLRRSQREAFTRPVQHPGP